MISTCSTRTERVARQIWREVAPLVQHQFQHPHASLITITGVTVTRDLSHAQVFYTFSGKEKDMPGVALALDRASGFFRSALARGWTLYKIPALRFVYDHSVARGIYVSQLIEAAVRPAKGAG